MRIEAAQNARLQVGIGVVLAAGVLVAAFFWPSPVLTGWLAAAVALQGVPAGALMLQMMMRLIPGRWGEELRLACEAGTLLAPFAALTFVPVLLTVGWIYPWARHAPDVPFQRIWMTPLPFAIRTILWFALLIGAGASMRRRRHTAVVAAIGLVILPVLGTFVAADWLMSLTPDFSSSAFGLELILLWVATSFASLLILRLTHGRTPRRLWVLGGVLLTIMLSWAYIQFMPFFISWSGNLPPAAGWYLARATPAWGGATRAFSILGCVPLLLLVALGRARGSARWLVAMSGSIIAGKLIEIAWYALPGRGAPAVAAYLASCVALGLVATGALRAGFAARIAAREPKGAH